jgi:hypothetical protein
MDLSTLILALAEQAAVTNKAQHCAEYLPDRDANWPPQSFSPASLKISLISRTTFASLAQSNAINVDGDKSANFCTRYRASCPS